MNEIDAYTVVLKVNGFSGAAVNDFLCRQLMSEVDNVDILTWSVYNEDGEEVSDEGPLNDYSHC